MTEEKPDTQRNQREVERDKYLAKLRERAAWRDQSKELSKQAEQVRAKHAANTAESFLLRLSDRSQFRTTVREKMLSDAAANQELMDKLGQLYRGNLKWFRRLEDEEAE